MKIEINDTKSGQFMVRVKATNGQILMWSEEYVSKQGALRAVETLKDKAFCAPVFDLTNDETPAGYRFEIDSTRNSQFMARFRASNGEIMIWSETYVSKQSAKECAQNVRLNIRAAELVDVTTPKAA